MRRREFITLLGGAVAGWPLVARAQQAMPVVGFLRSTSLAVSTPMVTGFRQGLTAAGFTEGQNVAIEYRYADSQVERLPGLVAELIRLPVAVIVANNVSALAAKAANTTVPIVFATGSNPVALPATTKNRAAVTTNKQNLKALHDAGVRLGFGSDSGVGLRIPGVAEHLELADG